MEWKLSKENPALECIASNNIVVLMSMRNKSSTSTFLVNFDPTSLVHTVPPILRPLLLKDRTEMLDFVIFAFTAVFGLVLILFFFFFNSSTSTRTTKVR